MDDCYVIIKPLVTEQGVHFANTRSAYSFQVNKKANKWQIRNAIERLYSVKVDKVRTANCHGKYRRKGKDSGMTPTWKKAVIYLKPEYHIDLF